MMAKCIEDFVKTCVILCMYVSKSLFMYYACVCVCACTCMCICVRVHACVCMDVPHN